MCFKHVVLLTLGRFLEGIEKKWNNVGATLDCINLKLLQFQCKFIGRKLKEPLHLTSVLLFRFRNPKLPGKGTCYLDHEIFGQEIKDHKYRYVYYCN